MCLLNDQMVLPRVPYSSGHLAVSAALCEHLRRWCFLEDIHILQIGTGPGKVPGPGPLSVTPSLVPDA